MSESLAATYAVELLLRKPASLDKARLLEALRRREQAEPLSQDPTLLAFVFPEHEVAYLDGTVATQCLIAASPKPPERAAVDQALTQTWDWAEAREAVSEARHTVLVTDFLASGLEPMVRLNLVHAAVLAVLEQVDCAALHWRPAQRIVHVDTYRASKVAGEEFDPISPGINVRMFRIENRESGEFVMDTVGLGALGLPDLQCHFKGAEPGAIAAVLYNTACYVMENGDVISNGHTVQGLTPEQKWPCQHEMAMVAPEREVLDLCPGPFAAGDRPTQTSLN